MGLIKKKKKKKSINIYEYIRGDVYVYVNHCLDKEINVFCSPTLSFFMCS